MLHARDLRAQQRCGQPGKAVEDGAAVSLDNAKGHPLSVVRLERDLPLRGVAGAVDARRGGSLGPGLLF